MSLLFFWGRVETVGAESHVHHDQFDFLDVAQLDKVPLFSSVTFSRLGRASVSDHVQPVEQVDSSKQSPLTLHPGRQRHHGKVRCRGQAAAAVGETHLPAEDQHA